MEAKYQYAWRHRLYGEPRRKLCDGREVRILTPGVLNTDAGPDFANARIKLDGTLWVGNVEIHERASDWFRHGHQNDMAYDGVILHVVAQDDARITRADGSEIPQLVISLPPRFFESYNWLEDGLDTIHCHRGVKLLSPLDHLWWLERMGMERLQEKSARVAQILNWTGGDWQRTLFITLARALGFGLNADPMEMLARSLPLNFAARHADNPVQIEAMLFGLAGMLNPEAFLHDDYYQYLCREYRFLSLKYNLQPPRNLMWKFARTRPQNFPYRRISMLANRAVSFSLMGDLLRLSDSLDALHDYLNLSVGDYWTHRFSFAGTKMDSPIKLSISSINLLIINAVIPFLHCYGSLRSESHFTQRAIDMLSLLPAEQNSLVRAWGTSGLKASNAFQSQALLYLKKMYCDRDKCLDCRFAQLFMKRWLETSES